MISFELSAEEAELQRSIHRYAVGQVRPLARRCEEEGQVAASLVDAFWRLGLAQIGYPERCGGIEIGVPAAVVVEEELAWGDAGVATGMPRVGAAGIVLAALSGSLCDQRLSAMLRDDDRSFAVLPSKLATVTHGSDGLSLSGTITVPAGDRVDALLVPCRLDNEVALVWLGLPTRGVQVLTDSLQLGLRAAPLAIVSFEETRISRDDVLAKGERACVALRLGLERELLLLTARSVGTARAAFGYAARYATQRNTFGRAIADHQAIAFMVADMGIRVDAASALLWNAAWAVGADHASRLSAVLSAGRFAGDQVVALTSDAVQILGGHGYIQDHPVEKWMRDARALANYTANVMDGLAEPAGVSA